VSLATAGRDHLEAGDGTMATFTDWMRLGEARMTPLATLALGAGMALFAPESADAAHPTTGERSVSGVRISLGEEGREWTLVPTLLDGKVESFLALREDLAYGENLTAVWYRKVAAADGTESWETKAFEEQDQSKAIRAVKLALALGDSTDESWPVAVAAVAAAAPEPMIKGVLESDALAPLVADLEDPQPIVEMLEGAGWKAAWIGPLEVVAVATAEPDAVACAKTVVLAALALEVEVAVEQGIEAGMESGAEFLGAACAAPLPCDPSITRYSPWIAIPPAGAWVCGPWVNVGWEIDDSGSITGCACKCLYTMTGTRTETRTAARWNATCTGYITWTQTRTMSFTKEATCTHGSKLAGPHPAKPHCLTFVPCPTTPQSLPGAYQCQGDNVTSCDPSPSDTIVETGGPTPVDPPPGTPGTTNP
jgi:hypothetical protein